MSARRLQREYWHKIFECKHSLYNHSDFNLILSIQQIYNGTLTAGYADNGIMKIAVRQDTAGAISVDTSCAKWLTASHSIGDNLNRFAVNVIPNSTGNVTEFYIYNNIQYSGYKVNVIDSSASNPVSHKLTFTGYVNSPPTTTLTSLPTTGTIIYSTLGEYLHMLSSSVNSSSETTGATSKAVLLAYEAAQSAQTAAAQKVQKSGDTMTGGLTVDSGGVAVNDGGVAIGPESMISGEHGFAQGESCSAIGDYSLASGYRSEATGFCSNAKGYTNTASGYYSSASGTACTSAGYSSWAGGLGATSNLLCEVALGRYNVASSGSVSSWVSGANIMVIGNGNNLARSNAFRVTNSGAVYALSAFNSTGADYAEYFEWQDGNPNTEDRVGYFVTLENGKIRIACESDDFILGAVSAVPSVIGNSYDDAWQGMYLTDDWGRNILERVEVEAVTETVHHEETRDEQGDVVAEAWDEEIEIQQAGTEIRLAINPDYSPEDEYVPRSKRDEWCAVGLLGRIRVYQDGSCYGGGYCRANAQGMAATSDSGYRVINVKDDIAEILFR